MPRRKRFLVTGPIPTLDEIAKELKISKKRRRELDQLVEKAMMKKVGPAINKALKKKFNRK